MNHLNSKRCFFHKMMQAGIIIFFAVRICFPLKGIYGYYKKPLCL